MYGLLNLHDKIHTDMKDFHYLRGNLKKKTERENQNFEVWKKEH